MAQYPQYQGGDRDVQTIFDQMQAAYDALASAESGNPAMAGIIRALGQDVQMQRAALAKMTEELSHPVREVADFFVTANAFLMTKYKDVNLRGTNKDGFAAKIAELADAEDAIHKLIASNKKLKGKIDLDRVDQRFRAAVAHAVLINKYTKTIEPPGSEIAKRKSRYGL